MNKVLFILMTFVVLVLALILYWSIAHTKKETFANDIKVMLFHATWCGHCKRYLATGDFEKAEKEISKTISSVEFIKYDYDKNKALGEKYNINSFPTIIAESGGKVFKFHGDRNNIDHLKKFVEAAIDGKQVERGNY